VDIWGAILVLARRYYLTVPAIAIAVGLAVNYANSVVPEYHASAAVVLIGPTAVSTKDAPQPVNPFVSLGTATIAATLEIDATSSYAAQQVARAHNSFNYSVNGSSRGGPILSVQAQSQSPQRAVATTAQVISILQASLSARQKPYAPNVANQMTLQVLSPPQLGAKDTSAKQKALAIAVGAGIAIAVLLTLIVDSMLAARSRRKKGAADWDDGAPATSDDESPSARTQVVRP
jgi:hypothetical protein